PLAHPRRACSRSCRKRGSHHSLQLSAYWGIRHRKDKARMSNDEGSAKPEQRRSEIMPVRHSLIRHSFGLRHCDFVILMIRVSLCLIGLALCLQHSDKVSQLVFHVAWDCDRVSDFFAQQQSISLTHAIERLFHRVFAHSHSLGDLRLRWPTRFVSQRVL